MIQIGAVKIPWGKSMFPDHSLLVKIDPKEAFNNYFGSIKVSWFYEGDDELFTLICVKRHLDYHFSNMKVVLEMPYIPHARMDRVKSSEDVFTLKYFCEVLNSLNFETVYVRDAHSNVSLALINNVSDEGADWWIRTAAQGYNAEALFFPDEGAMKRYSSNSSLPYAFGMKKRDWATGQILGLDLINADAIKGKRVLIVDDICSRGGTFYHSAKALLAAGAASVALYVTHLEETVFFGDLTPELIDRIYTTPSIFPRKRVEDIKAADGENWIDVMNESN